LLAQLALLALLVLLALLMVLAMLAPLLAPLASMHCKFEMIGCSCMLIGWMSLRLVQLSAQLRLACLLVLASVSAADRPNADREFG